MIMSHEVGFPVVLGTIAIQASLVENRKEAFLSHALSLFKNNSYRIEAGLQIKYTGHVRDNSTAYAEVR